MRQHLSDSRVLSLSYVFLLSKTDRCVLSLLPTNQQTTIVTSLDLKRDFKRVGTDVVIACRDIQILIENEGQTENEKEDEIDRIKRQSSNNDVKVAAKIVLSLYQRLTADKMPSNQKEGEAAQIIEAMRPVLFHCLISQIEGIKHEWLTYHIVPHSKHRTNQVLIPDLVLFVDPFTETNFELCFVEVKRPGNTSNGHHERDLVKLGKEMQLALSKLVFQRVSSPEVVGIIVEGYMATVYKMDLMFNGQYRMMKINSFRFINNNSDDILSLPALIEKLNHIKTIIERTTRSLYKRIEDGEKSEDVTHYIRKPCENPVAAKIEAQ